jgi:HD-GYP domain-containing protein (c-di-GMP phosphodiesterase class II)
MAYDQLLESLLRSLEIPAVWLLEPRGDHLLRVHPTNPALKIEWECFFSTVKEGVYADPEALRSSSCFAIHAHFMPKGCGAQIAPVNSRYVVAFSPAPLPEERVRVLREYFAAREERERLQDRFEEHRLINDTVLNLHRLFLGKFDLPELLPRVLEYVKESLGYSNCAILLLDPERKHLRILAAINYLNDLVKEIRIPMGKGITGWAALHDEVVFCADTHNDPRYIPGAQDIRSELAIPLKAGLRVIGVLDVESAVPNFFSKSDLRILEPLAAIIGIAVENARLFTELKETHSELADSFFQSVEALAEAVEAKDAFTHGHIQRSAYWGITLARLLNLDDRRTENVRLASMLHDVGKIGIAESILLKPGKLTPEERLEMEKHVEIGAQILQRIRRLHEIIPIVMAHQERWDGDTQAQYRGYPKGLKGEDIPLEARIITVVDAFDAMVSDRPYRSRLDYDEALRRLEEEKGKQFDPRVVSIFASWLRENRKPKDLDK